MLTKPLIVRSDTSVYFVDLDLILNNSNYGKTIILKIENKNKLLIDQFQIDKQKISKLEEDLKKTKNLISNEEYNQKINFLKKNIDEYNLKRDKMINELNLIKNNYLEDFSKQINPIIQEFMKSNEINILLNKKNIYLGNNNLDITNKIIKEIDLKLK